MVSEKRRNQKKIKLSKANKKTRWAPVWVVLKKMGAGKRVHPSSVTNFRRHWKRTKLKIKPRRLRKKQLG
jgi:ribosomal protein L39E